MGKDGSGIGSASVVLIFAVLCLAIFALISLSSAKNEEALVNANKTLVKAYYNADTLAEYVLSDILSADTIPESVRGIDIKTSTDEFTLASTVSFSCPVTMEKELYVEAELVSDDVKILKWQMRDTRNSTEEAPLVWDGTWD